ncbi:MAG: HAMP domain-containing histidine kinase, partial [Clostridiales bacterium]|nr:HAMP domain-containing histidine kinase [Clostridiales bacterium]
GYAQLTAAELKDKGVDEQAVSDLDAMVLETQRLGRLVDETQKASLSQHEGKFALIEATIKQLTKLYSPILEKRNTRLIIEIEKELPAVRCGQDELMQVLFNLLNNADKHGKSDEISITAKLEGDFIKVCVSEKSIGITPEDLPHIFDKYFVGGERGTTGSGLGLFICKEIIEAQGGNIKIESVFGKGTSACFTLPIIQKQSC